MRRAADPWALAVLLGILLAWAGIARLWSGGDPVHRAEDLRAARAMAGALEALREESARRGLPVDPALDPHRTGLVGPALTGLTTTLGSLPAKRTGLQPDAAALLARLLREAGLRPGGRVAVDSSGSFPGFAVASLVAAEALGAETACIVSLGASTHGATHPDFTLADMVAALERRGLLRRGLVAVSPGGGGDLGEGMDGPTLARALARAGAPVLREADLARNVAARRDLLHRGGRPAVLVSVGGSLTSAGPGEALAGRTGLIRPRDLPPGAGPGLMQTFLREGIPVVRVL